MHRKEMPLLNRNLFQTGLIIFGLGYILFILLDTDYESPSHIIIIPLGVSIGFLLINGASKVRNSNKHESYKSNIMGLYLILGLLLLFLMVLFLFTVTDIPSRVGDALTILALLITMTTDLTTDFFNMMLYKYIRRGK